MTPQRLSCRNIWNAMFCWLVPRHEAEVAAATRTKNSAAATARKK